MCIHLFLKKKERLIAKLDYARSVADPEIYRRGAPIFIRNYTHQSWHFFFYKYFYLQTTYQNIHTCIQIIHYYKQYKK